MPSLRAAQMSKWPISRLLTDLHLGTDASDWSLPRLVKAVAKQEGVPELREPLSAELLGV